MQKSILLFLIKKKEIHIKYTYTKSTSMPMQKKTNENTGKMHK